MNNEPVAWMSEKGILSYVNDMGFTIPLYTHPVNACKHGVDDDACKECYMEFTHPVKELTDEEIIEIGLLTTDPRFSHIESPLLLEFARAILRKASEK